MPRKPKALKVPLSREDLRMVNEIRELAQKLTKLTRVYGLTPAAAQRIWLRNFRWHEAHPAPEGVMRDGDIPF